MRVAIPFDEPLSNPAPARRAYIAVAVALLALACANGASADTPDSLATSWQAPWNPPHALARRQTWEQVVLFPGRIVSVPLSGLGALTNRSLGALEQSGRLPTGPTLGATRAPRMVTLGLAHFGDHSGVGARVLVQHSLPKLPGRFGIEYAATNQFYNGTTASWSSPALTLAYGYEWRPQDGFYGIGTSTSSDSASDYAAQNEFVRASRSWSWGRDSVSMRPRQVFSVWAGPRSSVTSRGREPGVLSFDALFPQQAAPMVDRRVEHFIYGASAQLDHRAGGPHWRSGWRALGSAEQLTDPVKALALHSAIAEGATLARYHGEIETGVSMFRDPRSLRAAVFLTDQHITAGRERLLVSDLSALGGRNGLGGYAPGRFHDVDLLLTRLSYVFPLVRRLEMDVHSEWGAVYPDVAQRRAHATLSSFHHSMGFAFHARSDRTPSGTLGADFSSEGFRLRYSLGAVE